MLNAPTGGPVCRAPWPIVLTLSWCVAAASVAAGAAPRASAAPRPGVSAGGTSIAAPAPLPADAGNVIVIPYIGGDAAPGTDVAGEPWKRSAAVGGFFEVGGRKPAGQPTWVYLYYNDKNLWLAFRSEGQVGSQLKSEIAQRDGKVWRDDSVEMRLDPTGTCASYFHLVVNSTGQVYDAFSKQDKWNARPAVRCRTDDRGWTAVVGLPFADLKLKKPQEGHAWAGNFHRNVAARQDEATLEAPFVKCRTSWVPGLVNYEAPEHFGRIVFGPARLAPVRMRLVSPLVIGPNTITIDPLPGAQFVLTGRDAAGKNVLETPPQPADRGTLAFTLSDDRARRIGISLLNRQGSLLARATYPMLSPEVRPRLEALPPVVERIEGALAGFPEPARVRTRELLAAAGPRLAQALQTAADPAHQTPGDWEKLAARARELELALDDPACLAATVARLPQADFSVGLESPMRKVMIRDFPFTGWFDDHYELALARNEHEGLQVVVMPFERDLRNVKVTVSPLAGQDGRPMPGGRTEVALVGHVDVADDTPYKDIEYHGWYPDPLLSFQSSCEAKAGDQVAFWIDVATAKETPAGRYEATVTVSADGCRPVRLRLGVTVWDFVLPDGTHLRNAFTYNEPAVGRFYGHRWDRQMRYKYYDFILDHRLNIDHLYRGERPDIEVLRYGVARGMNAFNVGAEFRHAAANNRRSKELDAYVAELKKENLYQYAYVYGFDEVREEKFAEVRQVFGNLRRLFTGLETMTTAADQSFGRKTRLRSVVDIWVPVTDWYSQDEARQLRREGRDMWWYICVVPYHPYANFFVEYPAIEPRLLTGAMSFKYEAGGFLYYLINLWDNNREVVGPGPYTKWDPGSFANEKNGKTANGDGSLLCPGPDGPLSTIRMENIRDGFEDYEYLFRLRELAAGLQKQKEVEKVRSFLTRAEALLAVPDGVVRTVVDFTTDPGALGDYRRQLAAAIIEGQSLAPPAAGTP